MSGIIRSRIKYTITCKHCFKNFTVASYRKDTALYCSRSCMALASRLQSTANCAECGEIFSFISSRANKAKYCTPKCYHKAMAKKGTIEYECQHCLKKFLGAPSQKRKFCSKACINKASHKTFKPNFTTVRKAMLTRGLLSSCVRCGFNTYPKILGVHHKDRNRTNNSLDNLEVLCPNCHSIEHMKHVCHGFSE
jgi:hypothetical protein